VELRYVWVIFGVLAVVALGVFGIRSVLAGDEEPGHIAMMKRLANSPGAFVFVDLQAMRADADLEDAYDALEEDVEIWIEPLDMDFDEVDRMGLGGKVAVFEGLLDLDQLRCKLEAHGFVETRYRGVEIWEWDPEGEVIICPDDDGVFSCLESHPCWDPCRECDTEEAVARDDCAYVNSVALMSSRGTFSRGHETVLTGRRDWVRDSIGVIKFGDASIYDDGEFDPVVDMVPEGIVVKFQKARFLDVYEYEGLQVSGISVTKLDEGTLEISGVCQFSEAEMAENAVGAMQSDLENDESARWKNVSIEPHGEFVRTTFETDIARRPIVDVAPPCITAVTVNVTTMTSAVIAWATNEPATGRLEYGETEAHEAIPAMDGALTTTHAIRLGGLLPDTEYHFRIVAADASGNQAVSPDFGFRTLGSIQPDSYAVIDDNGQLALRIELSRIQLEPSTVIELSLTDSNGVQVGYDYVNPGDTAAVLHMAEPRVTPNPGTYTLSFADASGRQIIWSEFTFLGVDTSVSQVGLTWQYVPYAGSYTLYGMTFRLQNAGDLPVYVDKAQVTIGTSVFEAGINEVLLPGEDRVIYEPAYVTGVAPASKKFVLLLMDQTDKVFYTYSSTVTPS
jgi:hypothetical protein